MKSISNKSKIKLNSKISKKKQIKRKNKKSLKLVKNVQKGGHWSNDELFSKLIEFGVNIERDFPNVYKLVVSFSNSRDKLYLSSSTVEFWSYESKIKPSTEYENIFDNPLEWYMKKNPEFKIIKKPTYEEKKNKTLIINNYEYSEDMFMKEEIYVPEFIFLVVQMIKDLLFLLFLNQTPKFHKNNKGIPFSKKNNISNFFKYNYKVYKLSKWKNILKILELIEKNIIEGYKYCEFIEYLCEYIKIFTYHEIIERCDNKLKELINTKFTPFIIVPSLIQIDYSKVLNLLGSPILNFRLINNRQKIHGAFATPCDELSHDLFHSYLTHLYLIYLSMTIFNLDKKTAIRYNEEKVIYIVEELKNFKKIFISRNDMLRKLYPYYNYNRKYINLTSFYFSLCLFELFHEKQVFDLSSNITDIYENIQEYDFFKKGYFDKYNDKIIETLTKNFTEEDYDKLKTDILRILKSLINFYNNTSIKY
jgi:hypothetical protein